jgi:hypothetical protein
MKALCAGLLLGAAACAHLTPFSPRALSGQTFSLRPGWSMALAVDGSVAGRPAVIHLAVEEPLSRVTEGCFQASPEVLARVDVEGGLSDAGPLATPKVEEQVLASGVLLGKRLLGDVRALRDPGADCELTLGSEVLIGFVLEANPETRTVAFHTEMPFPPRFQSEESVVLELTLDPRTDRPSLAVQMDAALGPLTLPMLLSTAEERVRLSAAAGRALQGSDVGGATLAPTSLALAPGWALHHLLVSVDEAFAAEPSASPEGAPPRLSVSGVLGADAWGHYRALIDLRGQHLVLYRRPPPVAGGPGPESWTHLSSDSTPTGSLVRFISWQLLDRGGQLSLEPGYVRLKHCRVGLTFGPLDPGASLQVAIPWPALKKELPECFSELATVPAWTGELNVSQASRPCAGSCVYAQELESGRTVCSCSLPAGVTEARGAQPGAAIPASEAPEPKDPPAPRRRAR